MSKLLLLLAAVVPVPTCTVDDVMKGVEEAKGHLPRDIDERKRSVVLARKTCLSKRTYIEALANTKNEIYMCTSYSYTPLVLVLVLLYSCVDL